MFNQLDVVMIMTTKKVKFLSGPKGFIADPKGHWIIAGFIGSDVLLTKDSTSIKIPISDIKLVAKFSVDSIIDKLNSTDGSISTIPKWGSYG